MMPDMHEKAMGEYPHVNDHRFRVEHTQILDEADIKRFAKLGAIASVQGIHATSDLPWALDRLGVHRTEEEGYPWQKLLKEYVTLRTRGWNKSARSLPIKPRLQARRKAVLPTAVCKQNSG